MKGKLIKSNGHYFLKANLSGFNDIVVANTMNQISGLSNFGGLSMRNCKDIDDGYSLDELLENYVMIKQNTMDNSYSNGLLNGYRDGFEKAIELNQHKQFTLDDIYAVFNMGKQHDEFALEFFINQKNTEKEWDVEIVQVPAKENCSDGETNWYVPKLDSEGCVVLRKI